jgi:hypothetical protein
MSRWRYIEIACKSAVNRVQGMPFNRDRADVNSAFNLRY